MNDCNFFGEIIFMRTDQAQSGKMWLKMILAVTSITYNHKRQTEKIEVLCFEPMSKIIPKYLKTRDEILVKTRAHEIVKPMDNGKNFHRMVFLLKEFYFVKRKNVSKAPVIVRPEIANPTIVVQQNVDPDVYDTHDATDLFDELIGNDITGVVSYGREAFNPPGRSLNTDEENLNLASYGQKDKPIPENLNKKSEIDGEKS